MKKRVRIKDVAEKAGVSTGTVDRVIHNRGKVNSAVKKKVEQVMKDLGYERNLIASALAKNQVLRFGVLLPDPNLDPYWKQSYQGVEKAEKFVKHYGVIIEKYFFELLNPDSFLKEAKRMMKQPYDAVLFPPLFLKEGNWLVDTCNKKGIPNVMVNTNIPNVDSLCYIGQDSFQSGVLAARLISIGIPEDATLLILNLTKGTTKARHLLEKVEGFKDYFKDNKHIKIVVEEFESFSNKKSLRTYFKKTQQQYPNLSGIFFTNSRAYFAIDILDDAFLKKTKVVGFDLIDQNIKHLQTNKIDFLINQNPFEQGYLGIINLYRHLLLKKPVEKIQHLSLDIVVKENIQCYVERGGKIHIV